MAAPGGVPRRLRPSPLRSNHAPRRFTPLAGDPARYVSHLPVHQDGSCNGLQHYAALGRDLSGGFAVNLTPSDRPQARRVPFKPRLKQSCGGRWAAGATPGL